MILIPRENQNHLPRQLLSSILPNKPIMSNLVSIHPATHEHKHFIKATWLKNFGNSGADLLKAVPADLYYKNQSDLIDKAWTRCKVLVAQSITDPEVTAGYIAFERPNTIHYVYVRHDFYRFGIATELLKKSEIDMENFIYTHRNTNCRWLIGHIRRLEEKNFEKEFIPGKFPKGIYNPYLFVRN